MLWADLTMLCKAIAEYGQDMQSQTLALANIVPVRQSYGSIWPSWAKRLLEMSSVAENNRIIPTIDKLDNKLVSVTDDKPL